jgi:hypothetical protein
LLLVDHGANGGVAGSDVHVLFKSLQTVDIKGIDNHQLTNICIGTVGGVVSTQKGPDIAVMHQYALLGKGSSIHSPCQLESYHNDINDKSIHVSGCLQQIKTLDGYIIHWLFKPDLQGYPSALTPTLSGIICHMCSSLQKRNGTQRLWITILKRMNHGEMIIIP